MLSALSGALKTLQRGLGSREVAPETADPPSKGRGCPFTGSVAAAPASGEPSLLERIGGSAALKACVDDFYGRLLQEPSLQAYLEGVDLARLKAHQYNFMRIAFTKIPDGMDVVAVIRKAHARLFAKGLCETHFDLVAGHLVATMRDAGVAEKEIDEAVAIIEPLRAVFQQAA